jgi:hypothetical protein
LTPNTYINTGDFLMGFNHKELEEKLGEACGIVHNKFLRRFSDNAYISAGGAKLETLINDLQQEFEDTTLTFLKERGLHNNAKAKAKAVAIAKVCARKCLENFNHL